MGAKKSETEQGRWTGNAELREGIRQRSGKGRRKGQEIRIRLVAVVRK